MPLDNAKMTKQHASKCTETWTKCQIPTLRGVYIPGQRGCICQTLGGHDAQIYNCRLTSRPVLILGAGRIVGAPSDWFKRSRDCDIGDPSFRTVFQTSHAQCAGYGRQNFVHRDIVVVPYFGICICFAFICIYSTAVKALIFLKH